MIRHGSGLLVYSTSRIAIISASTARNMPAIQQPNPQEYLPYLNQLLGRLLFNPGPSGYAVSHRSELPQNYASQTPCCNYFFFNNFQELFGLPVGPEVSHMVLKIERLRYMMVFNTRYQARRFVLELGNYDRLRSFHYVISATLTACHADQTVAKIPGDKTRYMIVKTETTYTTPHVDMFEKLSPEEPGSVWRWNNINLEIVKAILFAHWTTLFENSGKQRHTAIDSLMRLAAFRRFEPQLRAELGRMWSLGKYTIGM